MENIKVLIVEDNSLVAEDCSETLLNLGYTVIDIVAYGEKAVEVARTHRPDLVLMDIKLRGQMDGIRAAEQIYFQFKIPVVYVSAFSDTALLERARKAGPFGYIVKPFSERELAATLAMVTERTRIEKENRRLLEEIKEKEEYFRLLTETAGEIILSINLKGDIQFVNKKGLEVSGYTIEEAKKSNFERFIPPSKIKHLKKLLEKRAKGYAETLFYETVFITKDGSRIPVEVNSNLIAPKGKPVGVLVTARDITDRKKNEQEREKMISKLEDALENIKTLKGLIPICSSCHKIRDDKGYWNFLESYIQQHSDAQFSHSICPDCAEKFYGEEDWFSNYKDKLK